MTRIPIDTPIPDALRDVFAAASNNRRPPLNLHRQMVHAPAVLLAYAGIRKALEEHGALDRRTRFAVMLATSAEDQVPYTLAVNSVLATRVGFEADQVEAILQERSSGDDKLDALLAVVRAATRNRGGVSEGTFQRALAAGYSEAELAEAFVAMALAGFVDQFVNYAQTPFDVPVASEAA
jgi:alkylhydroperoxidase family enzyme